MMTYFIISLIAFFGSFTTQENTSDHKLNPGNDKTLSVYIRKSDPGLVFALGDLRNALSVAGIKVAVSNSEFGDINILSVRSESELTEMKKSVGSAQFIVKNEGFTLRKDNKNRIWIAGGDISGMMYGILELAEQISLYGLEKVKEENQNPYMETRGIKFNIPLDVRTPSYSDLSDAGQINIPEMWNFEFWSRLIDNLARDRYNLISLWNLHPFPSMVKVPDYPDIALNDVKRSTGKLAETYDLRGTGFDKPEILGKTETVVKMDISEKIVFWKHVMAYAKERNISFIMMTWNIFTYGTDGKYGITDAMTNPVTKDYFRKSVRQMFLTYPDLAGIGVTTGENMGRSGEGFDVKEDWVYDTYGLGVLDAVKEQPGRKIIFVHRQHEAGTKYIIQKFKPLSENKDIEFLYSFKYAQAHVYSSEKQAFHTQFVKDIAGNKTLWTLRNDDNFYFRWGAPDFVRSFIKNIPYEVSKGFYFGSDNYIWGREFLEKKPVNNVRLDIEKHWYSWMIWGRLGYNPDLKDDRFIQIISSRFPGTDALALFTAWQNASMIYPVTTGFHWGDLDYKWYIEGCKSQPEPAQTSSGFHDVNRFITLPPHKETGFQSIPDYVSTYTEKSASNLQSPVKVADMLFNYGDQAERIAGKINTTGDEELKNVVSDIKSMSYLGMYYSFKIKGATSLALYRKTNNKSFQTDAIDQLTNALKYWRFYTESALDQYKNPLRTNRVGIVNWEKLTAEVENDIEIAKK